MKRASYKHAIEWLANYDDCSWINEKDNEPMLSISAALVADLFDVDERRVRRDIAAFITRDNARRMTNN